MLLRDTRTLAAFLFLTIPAVLAQSPTPSSEFKDLPTPPPLPQFTPLPLAPVSPAASATASPTPLPDGTLPLPIPAIPPAPALPALQPIQGEQAPPVPAQASEPLAPGAETQTLQDSGKAAMTKEMAVTEFYKQLDALIAQQRNPKVPDMKLEDAIK